MDLHYLTLSSNPIYYLLIPARSEVGYRAAITCHKNRYNLCVPDIHLNSLKSCFEQLS